MISLVKRHMATDCESIVRIVLEQPSEHHDIMVSDDDNPAVFHRVLDAAPIIIPLPPIIEKPVTAAGKVTNVVFDMFLPMADRYFPPYTPFASTPNAEEQEILSKITQHA